MDYDYFMKSCGILLARSGSPKLAILLLVVVADNPLLADQPVADQYPGSVLYSRPVQVIPGVWSAIGATATPTYENAGHNNNLSFIVTGDGVVVINSGASYLLARRCTRKSKASPGSRSSLSSTKTGRVMQCSATTFGWSRP